MKTLNRFVLVLLVLIQMNGCDGGGGSTPPPTLPPTPPPASSASNVLAITVNGSLCTNNSYSNKPCASVTICSPGTANCQTINGILLDTGSYGLRIFKQALSVPLSPVATAAGAAVAECMPFGDGSVLWGPIQLASVILGGEPAVQVPIQVIDSTFGTRPTACSNAEVSPQDFNGILGVGVFDQDCGPGCANPATTIPIYYSCTGASCSSLPIAVPLVNQVRNPVALLPTDNNGVIVQLPSVPTNGATFLNGNLILGIGTQTNNTLSGLTTFGTNQFGEFTTVFNGVSQTHSFIDSGSNMLFFNAPSSQLAPCPAPNASFYCPPTITPLIATNSGASGTPSGAVNFQIGNFNTLTATSNHVFSDIGGPLFGSLTNGTFDWGLPFFLGRTVAVGIAGKNSNLGTGPYWSY